MIDSPFDKTIDWSDAQLINAPLSSFLTLSGRTIDFTEEQLANAQVSIVSTPSGTTQTSDALPLG